MIDFDQLWNYQDPAATEARFRALLPESSNDPSRRAELLTQIARTHSLRHNFPEAHKLLDEAEQLLPRATPTARIRYFLERGRTHNSAGETDRARTLFTQAWDAALAAAAAASDPRAGEFAIDAAHMLAIVEKDPQDQLTWNLKALAMAETTASPWRASLHNNIGWTYHDLGNYPRSLEHLEKALALRQRSGKEPELRIARWCVAKLQRLTGRSEDALSTQRVLLARLAAANEQDGFVHEELAECLLAQGQRDEARPHFRRAHELLSRDDWLARSEPARIARLQQLGQEP